MSLQIFRGPFLRGLAKPSSLKSSGFRDNALRSVHLTPSNSFTTSLSLRWWLGGDSTGNYASDVEDKEDVLDVESFVPSSSQVDVPKSRDEDLRRIHILGAGNSGRFVAHAIAGLPDRPSITLIFRSNTTLRRWKKRGGFIAVVTDGFVETRHNFDVELLAAEDSQSESVSTAACLVHAGSPPNDQLDSTVPSARPSYPGKIRQLIVSIKAPFIVRALSRVAHRLSPDSSILFFSGGMGLLEEINKKVFPDETTRPTYINGLTSHILQATATDPFAVTHAGMGTIALGLSPRRSIPESRIKADTVSHLSHSARYLFRTLTRIPVLAAVGFSPTDMFQLQFEKLAVKAVVGPLTVVFDCRNGELLGNLSITRVIRLLLAEISLIARSLPELQGVPNVTMRFSPERLEALVVNSCIDTSANVSPMLKSVEAARFTEIDYLNGYIVRRGEEMGIKCLMNFMVLQLVKGKGVLQAHRNSEMLPIE